MGTNQQEDPQAIREVPSHDSNVGVSRTVSPRRIRGPRICYEIQNSESYVRLTLRLLMSYIYMEHLFLMFLDHTQRRSTVGRTPLDE